MTKKLASLAKRKRPPARSSNSRQEKAHRAKIAAVIAELDQLQPTSAKAAETIALFKTWLADESGYDEQTWPKVKKALNRERERFGAVASSNPRHISRFVPAENWDEITP